MKISLSDDRARIVRSLMHEGPYDSEDEVIDKALRLLLERDEQAKLAQLRREIDIGIEQADRSGLGPFDPQATLARVRLRQVPGCWSPIIFKGEEGYLELRLNERTPGGRSGTSYLRLNARATFCSSFIGENDAVWVEAPHFQEFLSDLRTLEAKRQGEANLSSTEPGELLLKVHSTDRAGHMAVSGQLGRWCHMGETGMALGQIPFHLPLSCPSQLIRLLADFQTWVE